MKNGVSTELQFAFICLVMLRLFYIYILYLYPLLEAVCSHPILIVKTENLKIFQICAFAKFVNYLQATISH